MPLHGGDGGWRPPPATLAANRSRKGTHSALMSIAGAGLEQLPDDAARALLASTLTKAGTPRMQGVTDLDSARPPLLLIFLLLKIPGRRRVSLHQNGRLGIGMIDRRSRSLAVVSVRSPWAGGPYRRDARARWRLDAYGNEAAASEVEELLGEWRELQRTERTNLQILVHRDDDQLRLRFGWSHA